jgi:hypothetical protein
MNDRSRLKGGLNILPTPGVFALSGPEVYNFSIAKIFDLQAP